MHSHRFVTEEKAAAILKKVNASRPKGPPTDDFREQLETVVEILWAIDHVAKHRDIADNALTQLCRVARKAESALLDIQARSSRPEVAGFEDLLHLQEVQDAIETIKRLDQALALLPRALFKGRDRRTPGPKPRPWYKLFVENLSDIAVGIGISATTGGDRVSGKETPFTMFVFEVEKLLPAGTQSHSPAACARQIERAREEAAEAAPQERAHTVANSKTCRQISDSILSHEACVPRAYRSDDGLGSSLLEEPPCQWYLNCSLPPLRLNFSV
jgi:hypothetical protein